MNVRNAWMLESFLDTFVVMLFGRIIFAVCEDNKFGLVLVVFCVAWSRFEDIPNCVP